MPWINAQSKFSHHHAIFWRVSYGLVTFWPSYRTQLYLCALQCSRWQYSLSSRLGVIPSNFATLTDMQVLQECMAPIPEVMRTMPLNLHIKFAKASLCQSLKKKLTEMRHYNFVRKRLFVEVIYLPKRPDWISIETHGGLKYTMIWFIIYERYMEDMILPNPFPLWGSYELQWQ